MQTALRQEVFQFQMAGTLNWSGLKGEIEAIPDRNWPQAPRTPEIGRHECVSRDPKPRRKGKKRHDRYGIFVTGVTAV